MILAIDSIRRFWTKNKILVSYKIILQILLWIYQADEPRNSNTCEFNPYLLHWVKINQVESREPSTTSGVGPKGRRSAFDLPILYL